MNMPIHIPPQSPHSEESLIGALLLDQSEWDNVSDLISPKSFYRLDHREIFTAIKSLIDSNQPADAVTTSEWLENNGKLDDTGGLHRLVELAQSTPRTSNARSYAKLIRDAALKRELLTSSMAISEMVNNPDGKATEEILSLSEQMILGVSDSVKQAGSGFESVGNFIDQVVVDIEARSRLSGVSGLRTGFEKLDGILAGLQKSDLIIIAGRPSMGKTAKVMNIASHVSLKEKKHVAVFSMEMSKEQLTHRMISNIAKVKLSHVREGKAVDESGREMPLTDSAWAKIASAASTIKQNDRLHVDETPSLSPTDVRSRARKLDRETGGLGLVIIDYMQLMQCPGKENRTNEISEISRQLKALAKELKCPVIALSQLNRSLETRPDKRPIMSDLRESGSIEQDADVIAFIYRDEVYNPESEWKGTAEILIRKQRMGPTGMIRLAFSGQYTTFDNYADDDAYGRH